MMREFKITLGSNLFTRIAKYKKATGRFRSEIIRQAITEFLEKEGY